MDLESLARWEDYTQAEEGMFLRTDSDQAPWITVKSNDKKRASVAYDADPLVVRRGRDAIGDWTTSVRSRAPQFSETVS